MDYIHFRRQLEMRSGRKDIPYHSTFVVLKALWYSKALAAVITDIGGLRLTFEGKNHLSSVKNVRDFNEEILKTLGMLIVFCYPLRLVVDFLDEFSSRILIYSGIEAPSHSNFLLHGIIHSSWDSPRCPCELIMYLRCF